MYLYMGHMRWKDIMPYEPWFWKKNNIDLVKDHVEKVDVHGKSIGTRSGHLLKYDQLIIATGSNANTLNIDGADLDGVSTLQSIQDLAYIESKTKNVKNVVIAGGGLIGVELAEMFHSRKIAITHLIRESSYSSSLLPEEESKIISQHIKQHGVDLRAQTEIQKINSDSKGAVTSVTTNTGEEFECQFVGIAIGVRPNVNWLNDSNIELAQGILVNQFLRTNIPDIYAIGDCAELRSPDKGRKAIEPIWYTGKMMGEAVAKTICGKETKYQPGIWFNSAKFFAIEYQCYGEILPSLPNDQDSLYWENKGGDKSIRINYNRYGVVGFNLLGVRFRQEVCHEWIHRQSTIEDVLAELELAFFDPEFTKPLAQNVREVYTSVTGKTILKKGNGQYNRVFQFLKKKKSPAL